MATEKILPRDMISMQGNDEKVWRWIPMNDIEVCVLIEEQRVFAGGALVKPQLQKLTQYDVTFHVGQAQNPGDPNYIFRVELPNKKTWELSKALTVGNVDIKVASFTTLEVEDYEYIRIYIYTVDDKNPKKGLIIKGVSITPSP